MLGIETQTLKSIDFAAGEIDIIASEEEKMEHYKQILEKKPALKLSITPSYNETLDTKALQEKALDAYMETFSKNAKASPDSYGKLLKEIFIKKFSQEAYDTLIQKAKEEHLERGAINEALTNRLASTFSLSQNALSTLATQRADNIMKMMTQKYAIPANKLLKNEIQSSEAVRETWVGCTMGITN